MATRYDAGHVTMSYNGIPVEQDKYQGDATMDFLNIADTFEMLSYRFVLLFNLFWCHWLWLIKSLFNRT